ncbi:DUF669 domain-containing protein [Viridibacillus sp. FSL R5-0477]|uniref:DUF669 domain-containing protein n=1 Tax=Viridibacillus arenosi FSL R5-213 TaxID=1227360 RepID=W4EUH8_9BACL|nr:DUF669 domain-containing protein [Viridibacillus arenosi]ETT84200.1 hypothetical protein C176_12568 [Viridibacillus arenosi FSL R5-213]OMC90007.1 hypothetical protein BK137_14760 [Viridibacillus arenosi]
MSFFKFNEEEASKGFELIEEGKYEVTIINAVASKTQVGKDKLMVDFEIRSDVPQKFQGSKVLYNNFTFEHEIAVKIVQSLLKAAGFSNGYEFKSAEDMANQLLSKNLQITVAHEKNDKGTYPKSKFYDTSKVDAPIQQGGPINVGSDDLPF